MRAPQSRDQGARNVVLVPAGLMARLQEHVGSSRFAPHELQMLQSGFRRTVLPWSTKWLFGNTFEAAIRLTIAGAIPVLDNRVARRVFERAIELDKLRGEKAHVELTGGLLYGTRGLSNHYRARGKGARAIADAPGVKELKDAFIGATDGIFGLNRAIEREAEYAALGKHFRAQMQEFTGSWFKAMRIQQHAIDQMARGILDTATQVQAGKYLDETLGKYSRFSPAQRMLIQTYAPFAPWYVNSVRFMAWTLPMKHPVQQAVLSAATAAFQKDYNEQHKDTPPGELMTAVRTKDGGYRDIARFTPAGFLGPIAGALGGGEGGRTSTAAFAPLSGIVLPQLAGLEMAAMGKDPFGRDLRVPGPGGKMRPLTVAELLKYGANQTAEELAGPVATIRRLREGGNTALPTSNVIFPKVKKGTSHGRSAFSRVFNPVNPIYLHPKAQGSRSGSTDPVKAALSALDATQGGPVNDDAVKAALSAIP